MTTPETTPRSKLRRKAVVIFVFLSILALDGWAMTVWSASWNTKAQTLLQILAVYTFAFGFIAETEIGKRFGVLLEDVASPNLYAFIGGNFILLSLPFNFLSVALNPRKINPSALDALSLPFIAAFAFAAIAYALFHIVVIIPLAYLSYLIAHVPIREIKNAGSDMEYASGDQSFTIKEFVASNEIALKNFLIAIPGVVSSLILGIVA